MTRFTISLILFLSLITSCTLPSNPVGTPSILTSPAPVRSTATLVPPPVIEYPLPLDTSPPTDIMFLSQPESSLLISEPISDTIFKETTESELGWRPPLYPTPWLPTSYDHFYFARPIAAADLKWILANYRYGGVFFTGVVHTGIDIPVVSGTKVYAAGPGRVNWVGYGLLSGRYNPEDPYGNAVVIRHDFGYKGQTLYTVYGHLSRIEVAAGQQVNTGDLLGLSGATGKVTGAHLHFEVRIGRNSFSRSRNPELWLSPPQGWGILAGKILNQFGEPLSHTEVWIKSEASGRKWTVKSYGGGASNSDPYYKENLVIGDLPAGLYTIWIPTETSKHGEITIQPGMVSYFTYLDGQGFSTLPPPLPQKEFTTPVPPEASPIP